MYTIELSEADIDFLHMEWGMVEKVLENIIKQAESQGYEHLPEVK